MRNAKILILLVIIVILLWVGLFEAGLLTSTNLKGFLKLNNEPVTFEISMYDGPLKWSKDDPFEGYINVYEVTPIKEDLYQGKLTQTGSLDEKGVAKILVESGEVVDFKAFLKKEDAVSANTTTFSEPPYKNFGDAGKLCKVNYLEIDKKLLNKKKMPVCAEWVALSE